MLKLKLKVVLQLSIIPLHMLERNLGSRSEVAERGVPRKELYAEGTSRPTSELANLTRTSKNPATLVNRSTTIQIKLRPS